MNTIFDEIIDRSGTNSIKWEFAPREDDPHQVDHTDRFLKQDGDLPMWVADMDFRCPEPVIRALAARVQHGIFGYSSPTDGFYDAAIRWMWRRHGWQIARDWICITPGVVPALNLLVRTFVKPGEKVLIQPPVYHPFRHAAESNGAEVVRSPLVYRDGRYWMDFDDLETRARDPQVKMAILCSPHNPVGRVWSRDELERFGRISIDNGVLVVADEIHSDLMFRGSVFEPFGKLATDLVEHSVICTAPSKTFNLAGLQTSCIVIANEELRTRFRLTIDATGGGLPNAFGIVALQTAYEQGEPWLEELLDYLQGNLEYVESFVAEHIPEIDVVRPEGTYLVWLDCRKLGLDAEGLRRLMRDEARVYLDDGTLFGAEGAGFERLNIACSRSLLEEALERMASAVANRAQGGS
ncbi:MAG: MalY/PatB family protein [Anaerolineales bacterium]